MPYIIKDYNSSNVRITIGDGTVDNSTSLNLVGKNVSNFGALQNENFLYLLENFAGSHTPLNPVPGQLWYDLTNLNYYNSGVWAPLATITNDKSSSQPNALYFDTANNQLFVNNGTTFTLVGPEGVAGRGTTRMFSTTLKGVDTKTHPVIKIIVDSETVGVISTTSFAVDSSNLISGISYVNRGITLKNSTIDDFTINGRSLYSDLATTATNVGGGTAGTLVYQSGVGVTGFINIGSPNTILTSNGSVPFWKDIGSVTVAKAANLSNGALGSIPYQTGSSSTVFLSSGTQGFLLTYGLTGPTWTSPTVFTVSSSTNARNANTAEQATTSTYASRAYASYNADYVPWTGVTNHPTTIQGYGIQDAITQNDIANQAVNTATMVINRIGIDNGTLGTVYGQWSLNAGSTFYATYADLAEKYLPDNDYESATVLSFGGNKEVTISSHAIDTAVAGIVSTDPAYCMNKDLEGGVYIALAGRVPCKVIGPIKKGDLLVTSNIPGVATAISNLSLSSPTPGSVIGKAIHGYDDRDNVGVIEVMVKSN
jgi:hypothetical protein